MSIDLLKIWPQYVVPQHVLSRLTGCLANLEKPQALKNWCIQAFIRRYGVDMQEAIESDPTRYANFNAFFTRALRPGLRPIDPQSNHLVSPADGTLSMAGRIEEGMLLQAKGHEYSVRALLGDDAEASQQFVNGQFATIYLSPKDYHRVHMPVAGVLEKMVYVPGRLFSVNPLTTSHVPRLFARNERIICHFRTEWGAMAVVMVGAMIVASMVTRWEGVVAPGSHKIKTWKYDGRLTLSKGEEMGYFQLGSTVIVLMQSSTLQWLPNMTPTAALRLGQTIGLLRS